MKINATIDKEMVTVSEIENAKEIVKAIKNNKYLSDVVIDFANTVLIRKNIHRVILEKEVFAINATICNHSIAVFCVTFKHLNFYEVNFPLQYNNEEETWEFNENDFAFVNEYKFQLN